MSDWLASKLQGHLPQQPQYGLRVPPTSNTQRVQQQGNPTHTHQQVPAQAPASQGSDVLEYVRNNPQGEVNIVDAIKAWQGGPAARMEGDMVCPGCESRTGYTAYSGTSSHQKMDTNGNPVRGRTHCFECGYNGSYSQGDQSNWA